MTNEQLIALRADALHIFGPEPTKTVRDVIEWYHSSIVANLYTLAAAPATKADSTEPCTICNALIVPRNPTHYDAQDLEAARVRGKLIAQSLAVEAPSHSAPSEPIAVHWIRDNYQDHPTIDSLCSALTVFLARAALPEAQAKPNACKRCGGTGVVDDGEINCYEDGTPYSNGPVKCVKDCPLCKAKPASATAEPSKSVAPVANGIYDNNTTCRRESYSGGQLSACVSMELLYTKGAANELSHAWQKPWGTYPSPPPPIPGEPAQAAEPEPRGETK